MSSWRPQWKGKGKGKAFSAKPAWGSGKSAVVEDSKEVTLSLCKRGSFLAKGKYSEGEKREGGVREGVARHTSWFLVCSASAWDNEWRASYRHHGGALVGFSLSLLCPPLDPPPLALLLLIISSLCPFVHGQRSTVRTVRRVGRLTKTTRGGSFR